jgi:hypothetical protein
MSSSTLRIRSTEYELGEVLLRIALSKEGADSLLTFDLFANSQNLSRAGVAINSMTIMGTDPADIESTTFELDESDDDALNELRESVICEPGAVMELSHLRIMFGAFQDGLVDVRLEAKCFRHDDAASEEDIPVAGALVARIQI